ncbi:phage major tail protein, phi13 family [Paenibacillus sp. UNCCL117]|uniref:major tail protein n=1 Tax=unclassified Paenibacillus TaxID=185978 RepID=UPI00088E3B24|nr:MULTISPECIES: major tail protein [unclassified Paenibacillus]SDD26963.1 phage major tail protein, phi13 family [Paenibacillus sp. cl123]SFW40631.1 phage major tail protein, phi13 family [Paenibacillus sp. UNCCL117]
MAKNIPVGLDMLFYALMTDESNETYDTPKRIWGAIQATITPTINSTTLYADDIAYESASSMGDIAVSLNVADIPSADRAALLGHTIDANGGVDEKSTDIGPYVAIGYRRRMSNKKFRYVWLYKGRFTPGEEEANTKGDTPTFQTPTINATFISRQTDERWRYGVTEGDPGVSNTFINNFFNTVYIPGADTTLPTVTTTPANNATAVPASSSVKWTFNKAINPDTVNAGNFLVQKADGSGAVQGTLTIDTAQKVVTFTPAANLAAATAYLASAGLGVKDIAGNALAATNIIKFTTA